MPHLPRAQGAVPHSQWPSRTSIHPAPCYVRVSRLSPPFRPEVPMGQLPTQVGFTEIERTQHRLGSCGWHCRCPMGSPATQVPVGGLGSPRAQPQATWDFRLQRAPQPNSNSNGQPTHFGTHTRINARSTHPRTHTHAGTLAGRHVGRQADRQARGRVRTSAGTWARSGASCALCCAIHIYARYRKGPNHPALI